MAQKLVKSLFFAYSWHVQETDVERTIIRIYGLNKNNENVCVIVDDFLPYVYLELPDTIAWTENEAYILINFLNTKLGVNKPETYELMYKKRLYYDNSEYERGKIQKKLFPYLKLRCYTTENIKKIQYVCNKPLNVPGIGYINLRRHEHNASPVLQLTCEQKISTADWISFIGKKITGEDKQTHCTHEYIVKYKSMVEVKIDLVAKPYCMAFDLEVNSSDPTSMPKAERPGDKIFQISCICFRQGSKPETYKKILLSLGHPDQERTGKDIEIRCFDTECDLLIGFTALLQEKQPNVIMGYNIFQFDVPYMIARSEFTSCKYEFDQQGMDRYGHAIERSITWSSSAYKNQSFQFLDAEGRVFIDLLPLVKRDNKLSNYKLDTVAGIFLKGAQKDPLSHRGIFECYRLGMTGSKKGEKALGICGKYCIQDSFLVCRLFEVFTTWLALCEMSKVTNVPIFALYTQGQQLKVFSQTYRKCTHENTVVEKDGYISGENDHYVGATVFPPTAGVYNKVVSFDFCLAGDTMITMADGLSKRLDEIRKGDMVLAYDEMCDGFKGFPVLHGLQHKGEKSTVRVWLEDNTVITCTPDHKFMLNSGEWCQAQDLPGKYVRCGVSLETYPEQKFISLAQDNFPEINPQKMQGYCRLLGYVPYFHKKVIAILPGENIPVYDIEVETAHNFLANGTVVHNCALYPTTMIAYNICWSTLVKNDKIPDELCHVMEWEDHQGCPHDPKIVRKTELNQIIKDNELHLKEMRRVRDLKSNKNRKSELQEEINEYIKSIKPYRDERSNLNKSKPKHIICCKRKFRWLKSPMGVLPEILKNLLDTRASTKKEMKGVKAKLKEMEDAGKVNTTEYENLRVYYDVLDQRQLALKVSANSGYGATGTQKGYLPCMPCAMCTTYMGRKAIEKAAHTIQTEHKGQLIYGDSVSADTPILCRKDGIILYKTIQEISDENWEDYHGTKEISLPQKNLEVWTEKGFTLIRKVIRHKCHKKMYCVSTPTGIVDVTEDHSLLDFTGKKITPGELQLGQRLLTATLPVSDCCRTLSETTAYLWGEFFREEKCEKLPTILLNSSAKIRRRFLDGLYQGKYTCSFKSKLKASYVYYLLSTMGYTNNSVKIKDRMYSVEYYGSENSRNIVQKIELLEPETGYVYDLETENHHFSAGIGEIIVHNTDSNYVSFPHLQTAMECWDYAKKVSEEVSKLFPKPMSMPFEDKVYWKFMILTKKRYMSINCGRDGKIEKEINKKGVLLQRRDTCEFVRKVYSTVVMMIFDKTSRDSILYYILSELNQLCSGYYPTKNFVVTKSIGNMGFFESGKPWSEFNELYDIVEGKNDKDKICWKIGDYTMRKLPDDEKKRADKLKTCENVAEYYLHNFPAQAQLADKIRRRGQIASAGSRIEYVITSEGGHTAKQYTKIESEEYFSRHRVSISLDYLYYLKQLTNPLDQILDVMFCSENKYDNDPHPHQKGFVQAQYKFRLLREKVLTDLRTLFTPKLKILPKKNMEQNAIPNRTQKSSGRLQAKKGV